MHPNIQTVLNYACKFKSFVYERSRLLRDTCVLEVFIKPRTNGKVLCSQCQRSCPIYDTSKFPRYFDNGYLLKLRVFFIYYVRRVKCPNCGVKVESLPWSDGKSSMTVFYKGFLSEWCRSLSWKEVSTKFNISWRKVFDSVHWSVKWGLKLRSMEGIKAIGVDEVQWKKNHNYLTLVYEIGASHTRLLWIGQKRTEESFHKFFDLLGDKTKTIQFVCSDMWKPYLKVIKQRISHAIHILDRFHIVARLNRALDEVRALEHRNMKQKKLNPILTKSRWLLLKRPQNLKEKEEAKLKDLLQYNLKSIRGYLLKEDFQQLWDYVSPTWAAQFIDRWVKRVLLSKIEPMKREAKTIRKHKNLILNYFKAKKAFSSGIVEGLNNKTKLTMRKSYGFRSFKIIEIALYHNLGKLPPPPLITHRFW